MPPRQIFWASLGQAGGYGAICKPRSLALRQSFLEHIFPGVIGAMRDESERDKLLYLKRKLPILAESLWGS